MKIKIIGLLLAFLSLSELVMAQAQKAELPKTSYLLQNGRINVVVFVLATIFVGIILYLIRLERKLNKLEKNNH